VDRRFALCACTRAWTGAGSRAEYEPKPKSDPDPSRRHTTQRITVVRSAKHTRDEHAGDCARAASSSQFS
jgi:hypothetical protein